MSSRDPVRSAPVLRLLPVALLAACAHAPARNDPWYSDLPQLGREVAAARQVPELKPFRTVALPDREFVQRFLKLNGAQAELLRRDLDRTLKTFRAGAPAGALGDLKAVDERLANEQVLAFYEPLEHCLYLRETIPEPMKGPERDDVRVWLLAHELGHALQDQLGYLGRHPESLDEAIALASVIEGDANLSATLVLGARRGQAGNQALARARMALAMAADPADDASSLPPLTRAMLMFPYARGESFMLELHRSGGFDEVTRALATPPTRTSFIADPEAWLARDDARLPVDSWPEQGSFGAALVGGLIQQCAAKRMREDARAREGLLHVLTRYGDDRFHVDGPLVLWRSSWPGLAESDMSWVAFGLGAISGCLVDREISGARVGDDFVIVLGGDLAQRREAIQRETK